MAQVNLRLPAQLNDFLAKHWVVVAYFYVTYRKDSQEAGQYANKKSHETAVTLAKINSDDFSTTMERFQVKETPCFKLYTWKNGKPTCTMTVNGDSKEVVD